MHRAHQADKLIVNPPENEMATHWSILPQEISRTEEPRGLQSMGLQKLDKTEWLRTALDVKNKWLRPGIRILLLLFYS